MMENVCITIDIVSKLRKIHEGKTFSDNLVFITELFQNSQRANAKNVSIEIGDGKFTFSDDGCGCKKPIDILTLDHSSWESTDEGFGIGLWSWLAVEGVEGIEIRSNKWKLTLTTKQIFENNNLVAKIDKYDEKIKGFEVTIYSKVFDEDIVNISERIYSDGEMQLFDVYLNENLVQKKDLHNEAKGKPYSQYFSNKYFDATLYPVSYGDVDCYYERRKIDGFYPTDYVKGVVEVKKNALTLQEPDRKNVIRDMRRTYFIEKLEECRKELYLNIVKTGNNKAIDEYSRQIDRVLNVEDYEKYLLVDDLILEVEEEKRKVSEINPSTKINSFKRLVEVIDNMNQSTQLSLVDNQTGEEQQKLVEKLLNFSSSSYKWVKTNAYKYEADKVIANGGLTEEVLDKYSTIFIGGIVYKKVSISDYKDMFEDEDEEITSTLTIQNTKQKKKKDTLKRVLKKTARKVWVKASEVEDYSVLISKIEYYGVKVFIANNVLHENIFRANNISYITEIESGIQKTNIKWDVELKTKKEERFIELLLPVCNYYDLPMNTFKIGNLKLMIETILDKRVINREVIENKKESIRIYGVADDKEIILDRRALGLQRFNLSGNGLGVNEIKALMASMKTIAHELAHLLYNTEDNTKEHRAKEDRIYDELVNIYLSL